MKNADIGDLEAALAEMCRHNNEMKKIKLWGIYTTESRYLGSLRAETYEEAIKKAKEMCGQDVIVGTLSTRNSR